MILLRYLLYILAYKYKGNLKKGIVKAMYINVNLGIDTLKNNNLSIQELTILAIIYSFERNEKPCNIKRDKMAQYLNTSQATIERYYKQLKQDKWLFISKKTKKLTAKAIIFCQAFMSYGKSKKKRKKEIKSEWFDDWYKENGSMKKSAKVYKSDLTSEEENNLKELTKDLFSE